MSTRHSAEAQVKPILLLIIERVRKILLSKGMIQVGADNGRGAKEHAVHPTISFGGFRYKQAS